LSPIAFKTMTSNKVFCQARPYTKPSVAIMTTDGFVRRVLLLAGYLAGWLPRLLFKIRLFSGRKNQLTALVIISCAQEQQGYELTALVILPAEFNDLVLQPLIKARPGRGLKSPIFFLGFSFWLILTVLIANCPLSTKANECWHAMAAMSPTRRLCFSATLTIHLSRSGRSPLKENAFPYWFFFSQVRGQSLMLLALLIPAVPFGPSVSGASG
jgi:hypothetical protein